MGTTQVKRKILLDRTRSVEMGTVMCKKKKNFCAVQEDEHLKKKRKRKKKFCVVGHAFVVDRFVGGSK